MPKFFGFKFKSNKGFTLLEVLVAVFILIVGAGAVFSSISQTLEAASLVKDRFIASYLAQEGIEIVKNIRDSNWVEGESWNANLACCGSFPCDCEADRTTQVLTDTYDGEFLKFDSNNGYNYFFGTNTKFKRRLRLEQIDPNRLKIIVEVNWQVKGRSYDFKVVDIITNWLSI